MINFLPEYGDDIIRFTAFEGDKNLGNCTFRLDGYKMYFLTVDCGDDTVAEGLARAAMNCAANRNAYLAYITAALYRPAFARLGFKNADESFVEIPEALTSCACSHN